MGRLVQITGFNSCSGFNADNLSNVIYDFSTPTYTAGADLSDTPDGAYIINTDTLKIYRSGSSLIARGVNDANLGTATLTPVVNPDCTYYGLAFAVDNNTQRGSIVGCYHINGFGYAANFTAFSDWDNYNIYQAIIGAEQPLYTWQSVPAISGKNGILSLPTLVDTDGEPISGQSASVFSSLPDGSNVRALINGAL